jgi:alkylation response protein AidB-like acyl-CoA dehydrogenase
MDLAFTPEEQAFREQIRAWVRDNLPKDISDKVRNSIHLTRDDLQRWAKILGKQGWHGWGWPKQFGGPGWNAIQKHLFEEETALAGAPRVVPFGPVMVAPVIMAFGTPEQQKRFLPGIASGEVWWSQGYSEPGSGSDLASLKTKASGAATSTSSTARRPGPRSASTATGSSASSARRATASRRRGSAFS